MKSEDNEYDMQRIQSLAFCGGPSKLSELNKPGGESTKLFHPN